LVELGHRVMDAYKLGRITQGAPDHLEPVGLSQLQCLVPFVGGKSIRLSPLASLDFDSLNENLAGGFIGDLVGADARSEM
jgi:hypothetical protein